MSYLDRLKQLESGEIFHHTREHQPTKPTKGASDGFVGSTPGPHEEIHTETDAIEPEDKDGLIFQKVTRPLPTKPTKGIGDETEHWHWIVEMPDRVIETFHHPAATRSQVLRQYPDAIDLEPMPKASSMTTPELDPELPALERRTDPSDDSDTRPGRERWAELFQKGGE